MRITWTNEFPTTKLSFGYTLGEVKELIEEIKKLNIKGIVSELCDVYTCSMCAIETYFGIPMPIIWNKSADKWNERVDFFTWYLSEVGLEFKIEYLRFGGNYKRKEKRRKVIELAIEDQIE
ncbi:MAG: MazG nucleotide pyrophosphohydrolase domain-containing protein [Candidatus Thorarchaeota archaeon]